MSDKLKITGGDARGQWLSLEARERIRNWERAFRKTHLLLIVFNSCLFPSGTGGVRPGGSELRVGSGSKEATPGPCASLQRAGAETQRSPVGSSPAGSSRVVSQARVRPSPATSTPGPCWVPLLPRACLRSSLMCTNAALTGTRLSSRGRAASVSDNAATGGGVRPPFRREAAGQPQAAWQARGPDPSAQHTARAGRAVLAIIRSDSPRRSPLPAMLAKAEFPPNESELSSFNRMLSVYTRQNW